jgi:hypothetical protein
MSSLVDAVFQEIGYSSEAGPDEVKRIIEATLHSESVKIVTGELLRGIEV